MQTGAKLQLRLPRDIKKWLEEDSLKNDRSQNGQVVAVLRERMSMQMPEKQREEPAQE